MRSQLKFFLFISVLWTVLPFRVECLEIASSQELLNVKWKLKSFETVDGDVVGLAPDQTYTIQFDSASSVLGQADCNEYSANYHITTDNDSLSIKKIINTEAACSFSSRWEEFLKALKDASFYKLQKNKLKIFYNNRKKALNFTKN